MSYIGNAPISAAFLTDTFSGTGSQVAYTMTVAPANTSSIIVAVTGVLQDPSTYSVSGTTLTFSTAPPSGTSNISVRYLGIPASGVTTTAYRTVTDFTATAGQTSFSVPSYTVGYIDVYRNGVRLVSTDYTATTGTTVVLNNACTVGDAVVTESFLVSSVLNAIPATAGSISSTYLASSLTLTTPTLTSPTMSGAVVSSMASSVITSGTVVSPTSGTSVDFTGIPSWVKRITVMFNNLLSSGTSPYLIQLGTSGGIVSSGYNSSGTGFQAPGALATASSTAGLITRNARTASTANSGACYIANLTGTTWVINGGFAVASSTENSTFSGGISSLGGTLDRIRITYVNGTDTFTSGSINILYE